MLLTASFAFFLSVSPSFTLRWPLKGPSLISGGSPRLWLYQRLLYKCLYKQQFPPPQNKQFCSQYDGLLICLFLTTFFFRVTKRRISLLQPKVMFVPEKQCYSLFIKQTTTNYYYHLSSEFLDLSWSLRAKGGNRKWLLADDLGAEHSHYCHGDQSEGEKRGMRYIYTYALWVEYTYTVESGLTYLNFPSYFYVKLNNTLFNPLFESLCEGQAWLVFKLWL